MSRNTKLALIVVAVIAASLIAYGYQSRHEEMVMQQDMPENG